MEISFGENDEACREFAEEVRKGLLMSQLCDGFISRQMKALSKAEHELSAFGTAAVMISNDGTVEHISLHKLQKAVEILKANEVIPPYKLRMKTTMDYEIPVHSDDLIRTAQEQFRNWQKLNSQKLLGESIAKAMML